MKNLIGKTYVPNDNSYSLCLSSASYDKNKVYLAGTYNTDPVECRIISERYTQKIDPLNNGIFKDKEFINVEYKGHHYRVLYNKNNVGVNLKERVRSNIHNPMYWFHG